MDATSAVSAAGTAQASFGADMDTFLRMLTTQLQNQDPLNPLDNTEFVAQLAQFSQVEQTIQSNNKLDALLAAVKGQGVTENLSLLGKPVEAASDEVTLTGDGGLVNYRLERAADAVTIRILSADGAEVARLNGSADLGANTVQWDGRGGENGNGPRLDPGVYRVAIEAAEGDNSRAVDPLVGGYVAQVRVNSDGSTSLLLSGGEEINASQITAIADDTAAQQPAT